MLAHLEMVLHRLLELVGGWLCALAITLVVTLAALAFLSLHLYKLDRSSCLSLLQRLWRQLHRGWGWILAAAALLVQVYALNELRGGLLQRLQQQGQARYTAIPEPSGGATVQRAPRVTALEKSSRTQRIVLPPQLSQLEAVPGWNPEEARYGAGPAVNVQDELIRDERAVVLHRTIEVERYVALKLQSTDVQLKLRFEPGLPWQRRQAYQAQFVGTYRVKNPFPEARRLHFSFPLPDNSGTLSGFNFKVNGQEVPAQDVEQGLEWEGLLQPNEEAVAEVSYAHQGAQSWSYDLTGRREPIADFHLRVTTDQPLVKFLRGSLYPTRSEGRNLEWELQNQITSQSICLHFPFVPTHHIMGNLFIFAPLSLVITTLLVLTWARLNRSSAGAWRATLAVLASSAAYTLASYLVGYLPLATSLALAFGAASWLQWRVLQRPLWVPIAVANLAPFSFLAVGHTGLLLSLLGLAALSLTVQRTVEE